MLTPFGQERMFDRLSYHAREISELAREATKEGMTVDLALIEYESSPVVLVEVGRTASDPSSLAERLANGELPHMRPIPNRRVTAPAG